MVKELMQILFFIKEMHAKQDCENQTFLSGDLAEHSGEDESGKVKKIRSPGIHAGAWEHRFHMN